jgi:N-acetylmuramoyl-L-alanine amidase
MNIQKRLIPINFTKGRAGWKPIAIVIHLMDGTLAGTDSWFRNPRAQASTHYGVGNDGTVYQWVEESDTAWGNGRVQSPTWKLIESGVNPNLTTISIEHEGVSGHVWTPAQYAADVELVKAIAARHGIPLDADHIIVHSEIFAGKPNCAGKGFDKAKLLAMLKPKPVAVLRKNVLVKGDKSPAYYWNDEQGVAHGIPSWAFFKTFFGQDPLVISQAEMDANPKGDSFSQ